MLDDSLHGTFPTQMARWHAAAIATDPSCWRALRFIRYAHLGDTDIEVRACPICKASLLRPIRVLRLQYTNTFDVAEPLQGAAGPPELPLELPELDKVGHLGQLVRRLREAAGLTRRQLAAQTGIADSTLRNLETALNQTTHATLRRLLSAPAMDALPELCKRAGLALDFWDRERN